MAALLRGEASFEGTLVAPDAPGDASEPVGECHGGDVVTTASLNPEGPVPEIIGFGAALGGPEHGSAPWVSIMRR